MYFLVLQVYCSLTVNLARFGKCQEEHSEPQWFNWGAVGSGDILRVTPTLG